MKITTSDILKYGLEKWMGKRIYFLREEDYDGNIVLMNGVVTSYDKFSLFVGKQHAIRYDKDEFFLSFDEMSHWLENNIIDV